MSAQFDSHRCDCRWGYHRRCNVVAGADPRGYETGRFQAIYSNDLTPMHGMKLQWES